MLEAIGSLIGGSYTNDRNMEEARRARQWSSAMSATAHQREVADLRRAGLNPILSATGGSGASTPGATQGKMEDPVTPAITTALEARKLKQEMEAIGSQKDLNQALGTAAAASAAKDITSAKNGELMNELMAAEMPAKKAHAKYDKNAAGLDAFLKRLLPVANSAASFIPKHSIDLRTTPMPSSKGSTPPPYSRDVTPQQLSLPRN